MSYTEIVKEFESLQRQLQELRIRLHDPTDVLPPSELSRLQDKACRASYEIGLALAQLTGHLVV